MMNERAVGCLKSISLTGTLVLALASMTGCVSVPRQPVMVDKVAFEKPIELICIMPVIDGRKDTKEVFTEKDGRKIQELAIKKLKEQGYSAKSLDSWNLASPVTTNDLLDLNAQEISRLLPPDVNTALIITLEDLQDTYKVMVANFVITASFSLVDREGQREIWKDAGAGAHGGGGLLCFLDMIGRRSMAFNQLVYSVLHSIPEKSI